MNWILLIRQPLRDESCARLRSVGLRGARHVDGRPVLVHELHYPPRPLGQDDVQELERPLDA
eukprot:8455861-Heterocapsa_arctica.AAC.1